MNIDKLNCYAVTLTVKLKPDGPYRFKSKTFRGISFAKTQRFAKERCIQQLLKMVLEIPSRTVTRDEIFIKECKLHNDFINRCETT